MVWKEGMLESVDWMAMVDRFRGAKGIECEVKSDLPLGLGSVQVCALQTVLS